MQLDLAWRRFFGPTYFSQAAYAEYNDPDPIIEHGRHGADGLAAAHTADI